MENNISPEEKLLRLIRKGSGKRALETAVVSAPKTKISFSLKDINKYRKSLNYSKIALIAFISVSLYLVSVIIYSLIYPKKNLTPKISAYSNTAGQIEDGEEKKQQSFPIEYYKANISGRQIFGANNLELSDMPAASAEIDSIKDINLLGIIHGDNPQAVIEDKKAGKTFYILKGQSFGEFKVEDIQDGKIIISYRGQKSELYL